MTKKEAFKACGKQMKEKKHPWGEEDCAVKWNTLARTYKWRMLVIKGTDNNTGKGKQKPWKFHDVS
jgi:hypothetical protein